MDMNPMTTCVTADITDRLCDMKEGYMMLQDYNSLRKLPWSKHNEEFPRRKTSPRVRIPKRKERGRGRESEQAQLYIVCVEKCETLKTQKNPVWLKLRKQGEEWTKMIWETGKNGTTQGLVVDDKWFDLFQRNTVLQRF